MGNASCTSPHDEEIRYKIAPCSRQDINRLRVIEQMTSYTDLPRDLQLKVISCFDMDTRIKIGMIFKLRVPQDIQNRLASVCSPPCSTYWDTANGRATSFFKVLGTRHNALLHPPGIYSIRFVEINGNKAFHLTYIDSDGRWTLYQLTEVTGYVTHLTTYMP